jgi:hypothetical protein
MRVRIDIGLDFDGMHTFEWEPSEAPGAVDVPRATLERWAMERETFKRAYLRWKSVAEEVEEILYRAEQRRIARRHPDTNPAEVAVAVAVAAPLPASRR